MWIKSIPSDKLVNLDDYSYIEKTDKFILSSNMYEINAIKILPSADEVITKLFISSDETERDQKFLVLYKLILKTKNGLETFN
jgi:hypothetical protein